MATTNQTATTNLQNNQNNANQWHNHLVAALMMGRANPQTMLGYLIGNKLLKQPFEKWVDQIQGYPSRNNETQTQTTSSFQDALKNAAQNIQNPTAFLADRANGVSNQQLANENFPNKFKFNPELMKEDEIQKLFGLSGGLLR